MAFVFASICLLRPGFWQSLHNTLCYAIVFPGRNSGLRFGFRPDSSRESFKIGPPAGRRAEFEAFLIGIWPKSGPEARFPARKQYCTTYGMEWAPGVLRGLLPVTLKAIGGESTSTPMQSTGFLVFCVWGGRAKHRRFLAASRPNPAPGGLGKGTGRSPARFAPIFSPVHRF